MLIATLVLSSMTMVNADYVIKTASQNKKLPIYCTTQTDKKASLSFDAAWGNEDTQKLINILAKYNVKATFFVVGEWVDKYPESVKALSDAGHEIMNHSDTHPDMVNISKELNLAFISFIILYIHPFSSIFYKVSQYIMTLL